MASYIILECFNADFIEVVTKDDGSGETLYFASKEKADAYAKDIHDPLIVELG